MSRRSIIDDLRLELKKLNIASRNIEKTILLLEEKEKKQPQQQQQQQRKYKAPKNRFRPLTCVQVTETVWRSVSETVCVSLQKEFILPQKALSTVSLETLPKFLRWTAKESKSRVPQGTYEFSVTNYYVHHFEANYVHLRQRKRRQR